jgi:MFS family permease
MYVCVCVCVCVCVWRHGISPCARSSLGNELAPVHAGVVLLFQMTDEAIFKEQLFVAAACLVFGYCIGVVLIPLLYAELIGLRMETIGLHSSWFFGVASLAMALGPIWGSWALAHENMNLVAIVCIIFLLCALVAVVCAPPRVTTVSDDGTFAAPNSDTSLSFYTGPSNSMRERLLVQ